MLRKIFGPKGDEIVGSWRKLHIEEPHNFFSQPNIIRMIKSRTMRWAGRVASMGSREVCGKARRNETGRKT
jgi:hypothetical protein